MLIAYFLCMVLLLAAWVLIPLFVAMRIYKRFPKTPLLVTGPLAGPLSKLTINTGGAFAAYFLILLISTSFVDKTGDTIKSATRPYWHVSGEVTLVDEAGKAIQASEASDQVLKKMDVRTEPPMLRHEGVSLRLNIPQEEEGFPAIILSLPPPFNRRQLDLGEPPRSWMFWKWWESTIERDNFNKTIKLGQVKIAPEKPARSYTSLSNMDSPRGGPPP